MALGKAMINPVYYDAHNHLQDDRLGGRQDHILEACRAENIRQMVVNGSAESDWPGVRTLALAHPEIVPSYGYHPWYVREQTDGWQDNLRRQIAAGWCGIGEIGLDRWMKNPDVARQETTFVWQLRLAAEHDRPVSIHCLQAWGRLRELLEREPRPARGFVLHAFGGPREFIQALAALGAYFSVSGYAAHERKVRQREAIREVPLDRLLIETDAPDLLPPDAWVKYPLIAARSGRPIHHPANLPRVYAFVAELVGLTIEDLAARVARNFARVFRPTA